MKEVVNLSSIFDISGNLKKGGKWLGSNDTEYKRKSYLLTQIF